jgi:exodeoxyribonuclease VII small subunit
MTKKINNFDEAYNELAEIAREMEAQELPIEQLAEKVERAAELTNYCKERLRQIEDKLTSLRGENSADDQ